MASGLPNTVPEQLSRDEYSQLDTPLSRLDSIEVTRADLHIKTIESQGEIDDDHERSFQNMKNTAAKMAARAESAL